ncbi:hypothetical protein AgCh_028274 [Apium graveolens]
MAYSRRSPKSSRIASSFALDDLFAWMLTLVMISLVVLAMAKKGKGKDKEPEKDKGKAKAKGKAKVANDTAKKTLLAMIREKWPLGRYTYTDIEERHPGWLNARVEEFQKYYRHLKGQSRSKAQKIVEDHIKVTIKRTLNELKKRVERKAREEGVSKLSLKPPYWSIPFWKDLLEYWENNEGHLHRSSVGSTNRQQVERLHSAGARSFNKVREERYAAILERMPMEVTQTGDREEPWDWWMEALEVPQEIRANPNRFARQLFDAEIATFARTALEASDPSSDPSQRLQWNNLIGGEIMHIVGSLIEDIVQKTEARVAEENNRRAMEVDKDYTSEDETSDDEDFGDGGGDGGGDGDVGYPLTAEEQEEKAQLLEEGFSTWSKKDFNSFIRACEKYGRNVVKGNASEMEGKTEEEVERYAEVFKERYKDLNDYDRIIKNSERGEARISRKDESISRFETFSQVWKRKIVFTQEVNEIRKKTDLAHRKEEEAYLLVILVSL